MKAHAEHSLSASANMRISSLNNLFNVTGITKSSVLEDICCRIYILFSKRQPVKACKSLSKTSTFNLQKN